MPPNCAAQESEHNASETDTKNNSYLTTNDVDETPVVLDAALCPASLLLLLILLLYLRSLAANLTGTSERTVLLACKLMDQYY